MQVSSITSLNPYINFNGEAAQAIELYERVLGAKRGNVVRAGDVPGTKVPADQKHRVLHGELTIGDSKLMVSDVASDVPRGGNVQVALHFSDLADMTGRFDTLAKGGSILVPLQDTFWGAKFGMLADPFGVRWMFNCAPR